VDYYFLEYILADDAARISVSPELPIEPTEWKTGAVLARTPAIPVRFRIGAGEGGALPPYVNTTVPLMSDALITALRQAGAENFQAFEAIVEDEGSGTVHRGYQAINILGLVDCVDEEAGPTLFPVIDSARARDLPLFRVAGDAGRIAVHRRVKERLQSLPAGASLDFRAAGIAVKAPADEPADELADDPDDETPDDPDSE
jgi:hypothetical protein